MATYSRYEELHLNFSHFSTHTGPHAQAEGNACMTVDHLARCGRVAAAGPAFGTEFVRVFEVPFVASSGVQRNDQKYLRKDKHGESRVTFDAGAA